MMSMMDSTTAVVTLMVLLVVVTTGVLVFARVLATRDGSAASVHVPHPHRSRTTEVGPAPATREGTTNGDPRS